MKSQINWKTSQALVLTILLIGIVGAVYAGETINYTATDLGLTNITDVVISNNLSKINYVFTNETATITIPNDASVQTFTIAFYGYKKEVAVIHSGGSSGSGHWIQGTPKIVPENVTINNETINLDEGLVNYDNVDGIGIENKTTQRERIESFVNNIGNFFESIWNWFKELFR